jgi:hypothetical protein
MMATEAELEQLTRDELNDRAAALGVDGASSMPNKATVVSAIVQAEAGGRAPRSSVARTAARARMLRMRRRRGSL